MMGRLEAWVGARSSRQRQVLAVVLGAVSALALPWFHLVPVLLISVPGLLMLLDRRRGGPGSILGGSFADGFWFGFGHYAVGLYWITEPILFAADRFWWLVPIAVPILASALGVYVGLTCVAARLIAPRGWPRALALAGAWVMADLLRGVMFTGFPWNPIGSAWAIPGTGALGQIGDVMLQPLAWVGAPGLTLATLVLAAAPTFGWRGRTVSAVVFAGWIGFGVVRLEQPMPAAPGVAIALLQGNIPEGQKRDRAFARDAFDRYLRLTKRSVAEARKQHPSQPIVVVWPETASPYTVDDDPGVENAIIDAGGSGVTLLVGAVRFNADQRPFNSLIAVAGPRTGDLPPPPLAIYDKWHLVPFGEYTPDWGKVGIQLIPGDGFARGPGPRTIDLPGLPPVGPLICYEVIFPGHVVDPHARPAWLVNVTNDAWFGNSSGPRQHLAAVRMRAVEEGLPIVRAANTGITAAYDARGRELGRVPMNIADDLIVSLPPPLPPTLFSRFGLEIPFGLALMAMMAGSLPFVLMRLVSKGAKTV